ncbi:EAL domain-containing protein [Burkholderia ambifaria]|uniref:EAL domain-containing protein n=1 Tax=Burkholderia ambifaria TaxID=152480 RepID=UPI001FC88BD0|nr:EAL domain-containing protein [Burkholderia ambifaria]
MKIGETFGPNRKSVGASIRPFMRRRFRREAVGAAEISQAIHRGAIELASQPIVRLEQSSTILYRECQARLRLADGLLLLPNHFAPHLQQLGVVARIDALVVRRAMALLSSGASLCLGINLSPSGMSDQAWWEPVLDELARRPEIARRLVFEIQETAVLVPGTGRAIRKALRAAGCRVVIDGFGVRYGVQTAMEIDAPDIIKVDESLLSGLTAKQARRVAGLVALARDMAPCVVVDGIECDVAWQVARDAGAQWVQGSWVGGERLLPRLGWLGTLEREVDQLARFVDRATL